MPGPWEQFLFSNSNQQPSLPPPSPEPTWMDTLAELAQGGRQQSTSEFIASTLSDPNPLHRAALPLGLVGRAEEWERQQAERALGLLTQGGKVLWEGKDPQEAWRESPLANTLVIGGLVPALLQPSTYLTLGTAPAARIVGALKNSPVRGVAAVANSRVAAPAINAFMGANRATDAVVSGAADVVRGAAKGVKAGVEKLAPSAFQESGESFARKSQNAVADLWNHLRLQGYNHPVVRGNAGKYVPDAASPVPYREQLAKQSEALEQFVAGHPNPIVQAFGHQTLLHSGVSSDAARRQYEVALENIRAAGSDPDELRGAARALFNQVRLNQEAARQTITEFAQRVDTNPSALIPAEDMEGLQAAVRDVLSEGLRRRVDLLARYADMANIEAQNYGDLFAVYQERDAARAALDRETSGVIDALFRPYAKSGSDSLLKAVLDPEAIADFQGRLQGHRLNALGYYLEGAPYLPESMRETVTPLFRTIQGYQGRFLVRPQTRS